MLLPSLSFLLAACDGDVADTQADDLAGNRTYLGKQRLGFALAVPGIGVTGERIILFVRIAVSGDEQILADTQRDLAGEIDLDAVVGDLGGDVVNGADLAAGDRLRYGVIVIEPDRKLVAALDQDNVFFILVGLYDETGVLLLDLVADLLQIRIS